jgi:hypothetical protein
LRGKGISTLALDCRFLVAFGSYQIGKHREAAAEAKRYIDDVQELRDTGAQWETHRKHVQKAGMLRYKSLRKLAEVVTEADRQSRELLAMIQEDVEFWGKEQADLAKFQLAKLKSEGATLKQRIAELAKIDAKSEFYAHSLYELVVLRSEAYRSTSAATEREAQLNELAESAQRYWKNTQRDKNPSRDVGVMVQMADAFLAREPFDGLRVQRFLAQADRIANSKTLATDVARDYHYVHLKFARKNNDLSRCEQEANWLIGNATGSSIERAALASLCALLDQKLADEPSEPLFEKAFTYYSRLRNSLNAEAKSSNEQPLSLRNAEHTWSRFAQLAAQQKEHASSAAAYGELIEAFPKNKEYLRAAGEQLNFAKSYRKSYQVWRTLLQLLDETKDGKDWYEAKYNVVASLSKTEPKKAAEVMKQFEALYMPVQIENYNERFKTLAIEIRRRAAD